MSDIYYSNVVLLLHFDGTNGATSFTDSSNLAWTGTCYSGATLSTSSPLFGTASLNIPSGGGGGVGYIDVIATGGADFRFGTGDFTVEGQCNTTATTGTVLPLLYVAPTSTMSWSWYVMINASGHLEWWRHPLGNLSAVKIAGATTAPVNTGTQTSWAVSRVSGVLKLFVEGVEVASAADTTDYTAVIDYLIIAENCTGKHDEIRITKGVGRYTAGYTPQTTAFSNTAPITEGFISVSSVLGAPAILGITNSGIQTASGFISSSFGTAVARLPVPATGISPSVAFGTPAYEIDRAVAAAATGPFTQIGEAQAVRGIPLLPPGSVRSSSPTTTFGAQTAVSSVQCVAVGVATTNAPAPLAQILQPASGFVTGAFGSAASVPGARATGLSGTMFGTPGLASARVATGALFGNFGLPSSLAPAACVASGWTVSQFGSHSAADAYSRTRSAVFRQTFGRAQAERTAP